MATVVHTPTTTTFDLSDAVPGTGENVHLKTGAGRLVWNAGGASSPQQPFHRVRWIGGQYDTTAAIVRHVLRGAVTSRTIKADVSYHQTRAVITTHRLRGKDD